MENENKDFMGEEIENTLTPEEKVQADISEKIADAAAEVQDEINEAALDAEEEATCECCEECDGEEALAEEAWMDVEKEAIVEKPEPVKVTVKKSSFILSLIGAAVAGALILLLCLNIPKIGAMIPEGSTVATVNGEKITDLDVKYYVYAQAMTYANENGLNEESIKDFDWDQEIDGEKLSDTLKNKALEDAVNEVLTIQKGAEAGITLDDAMKAQIDAQISGITATYGEDGFALRARTMGIPSIKQYAKMYEKVMAMQTVQEDITANPDKYYPEDEAVLNETLPTDKASVKHILIKFPEEGEEGEAASREDKLATAQSVLERAKNGEDFDALVDEFNEDPGATKEGYTFGPGEMAAEFEAASFALKIGEISDIVETTYGYHIIKRIRGLYDLQEYWKASSKITVKNGKIDRISISDIMADVAAANEAIAAETAAAAE